MSTPPPPNDAINRNAAFYGVFGAFTILSTAILVMRLVSKRLKEQAFNTEDGLSIASWVLAVASSAQLVAATQTVGLGYHVSDLQPQNLVLYAKYYYAYGYFQITCIGLAKISVLLLFYRTFVFRWARVIIITLIVIVVLWWVGSFLAFALICIPVESNWNPTIPHHCGNSYVLLIVNPVIWIVTDFAVLMIPLPVIHKLQLSRMKKVGLALAFLTGGFTCVVACVRFATVFKLDYNDITWSAADTALWNIIEVNVSVVCTSMILIQPVLQATGRAISDGTSSMLNLISLNEASRDSIHSSSDVTRNTRAKLQSLPRTRENLNEKVNVSYKSRRVS